MHVKICCDEMERQIDFKCDIHPDPFDCPDNFIIYISKFDEYGLIVHDGGSSYICISYCPWCGSKLPDSKRDLWWDSLEKLGFDDPLEQEIPKEFLTNERYRKLNENRLNSEVNRIKYEYAYI